eukprot:CAMPEP_0183759844 /NCGR_PEP_ID=MMETSP0739-20130205/7345_1 /TAXON_ID=385413 /ORGANISM="Thalassiosira miniscula, Strain CCMP1093" /LENGTH=67 /DNA_ID=CAMNT_0025997687 /DNA_START=195 /DNA_END=395 /DNA_ORIENTATION=-
MEGCPLPPGVNCPSSYAVAQVAAAERVSGALAMGAAISVPTYLLALNSATCVICLHSQMVRLRIRMS